MSLDKKPNDQQFWMCYVEGAASPQKKHYSEQEAVAEASRLLGQSHSHRVYVLSATHLIQPSSPPVEEVEMRTAHQVKADRDSAGMFGGPSSDGELGTAKKWEGGSPYIP